MKTLLTLFFVILTRRRLYLRRELSLVRIILDTFLLDHYEFYFILLVLIGRFHFEKTRTVLIVRDVRLRIRNACLLFGV